MNGNFYLTLIDTLDTLVVLNDPDAFEDAVRRVIAHVSFDVDTKPQIFEANIRILGGLLSGHIFANQTGQPFYIPWYRGELLELARDLGERFLPAFQTPTGMPYARVCMISHRPSILRVICNCRSIFDMGSKAERVLKAVWIYIQTLQSTTCH